MVPTLRVATTSRTPFHRLISKRLMLGWPASPDDDAANAVACPSYRKGPRSIRPEGMAENCPGNIQEASEAVLRKRSEQRSKETRSRERQPNVHKTNQTAGNTSRLPLYPKVRDLRKAAVGKKHLETTSRNFHLARIAPWAKMRIRRRVRASPTRLSTRVSWPAWRRAHVVFLYAAGHSQGNAKWMLSLYHL